MSPAVTFEMSNTASSNLLNVPRLRDDGSNWVDYEDRVMNALGSKGLVKYIQGTAAALSPYPIESGVPVIKPGVPATPKQIDAREKWIDEHDQKEYLARH